MHSEHLFGEYWHRAFTVSADTPHTRLNVSFGANNEVTGGPCAVARHADARARGAKRIQIEPHLSITAAASAEWIPIKPKTDPAFMFAMIHVLLHEHPRERLDVAFLRESSSSPYLVGPSGYYLRDAASQKPLVWDTTRAAAVAFDTEGAEPMLEGRVRVRGAIEVGADDDRRIHEEIGAPTAFTLLVEHMRQYGPEWAASICDVPAAVIRRVANEYLEQRASARRSISKARSMPFRPVSVTLGKTVNNGWGAYECCWARTLLAVLVGALEVPGGTLGTTVRLNRPLTDRHAERVPAPDGFMQNTLNPTRQRAWARSRAGRNATAPGAAGGNSGAVEPGTRAHASCLDVPDKRAEGLAEADHCRRSGSLSHQSGDLVLGHPRHRRHDGDISLHGLLRVHAR